MPRLRPCGGSSMQADPTIAIDAEAAGWLIRQRDPAFADWDGFTDWLAADPAHAAAYDALASLDADLDALPVAEQPQIVWDAEPIRHRPSRRAWLGGALAAAIVGVIGVSSFGLFDDTQRIETLAGEHRSITLADGSKIEINGASTPLLADDRPRFARLRSEEHTSELQSLMRISYAVFCLKKKNNDKTH